MPAHWRISRSKTNWDLFRPAPSGADRLESKAKPIPRVLSRRELEADLKRAIQGEVRFNDGDRALYSTDGSNYRQIPIGIVVPRSEEDVIHAIAVCHRHGAPVLARGGGTSLAGQCCNVAVVIDFSKYLNRIRSLEPEKRIATVEPGLILDDLRNEAEKYHLTFGPDPSTHNHCTLGGMIGNNSCGTHSEMAGRTSENIEELDILLYDGTRMRVGATNELELERIIRGGGRKGEIYARLKALRDRYGDLIRKRFPKIPRRVSGYNLYYLLPERGFHVARALVGSEGTCVTVLGATTRLVYSPPFRTVLVLGFRDIFEAADHVPRVTEFGPIGLEGIDDVLFHLTMKKGLHPDAKDYLPKGNGWLIVEFGGATKLEADAKAYAAAARLKLAAHPPSTKVFDNREQEMKIWEVRESGLGATARVPGHPDTWEGWEDSAVPPERLGDYLRDLRKLFNRFGYECALYGHFGQGCVHTRIDFDFLTDQGIRKYRAFMNEATDLVLSYGGSLSGEHGDGQSRAEFLPKMFGPELLEAFREFKSIWDPEGMMNPGKVVDPYRVDQNLRFGVNYNPPKLSTEFQYEEDRGDIARASLRCVGIGKCRRMEGGTMCPSFMATREEKHSTRGRARLFHEVVTGDFLKDRWKSDALNDALHLCLSCKGCKKDCPMNVDMATYKAEFLSHYYHGRRRPITAYSMGLIDRWARLASLSPELANLMTQTPGLRDAAKAMAGIAPQRALPAFASRTFKAWFRARGPRNAGSPQVLLWPDTFNNHFHPDTAKAAVRVLEAAGFQVIVPSHPLCCGRPLYDFGMLDLAKSYLRRVLRVLRQEIRSGIPIVALEPSCLAVFQDELKNLFPADKDGMRLREQSYMLSEFLEKLAPDFRIPKLNAKALVQIHCHHKSVLDANAEEQLLSKLGLETEIPEKGCCGMAGSFGFEAGDRYEVSMKIAEKSLLPAVRSSHEETLIVADGFSCRTQIEQGAGRRALHLAEVIDLALARQGMKSVA